MPKEAHMTHCTHTCKYGEDKTCPGVAEWNSYEKMFDRLEKAAEGFDQRVENMKTTVQMITRGKHYSTGEQLHSAASSVVVELEDLLENFRDAL
jgi:hypothetical protein